MEVGEKMRPNKANGNGFTLIELVVLVALVGILASILVPTLARSKTKAQSASCAAQLKQWGLAFQMYADDNHGWLFTTRHWESTEFTVGDRTVANVYGRYLGNATSERIVQLRNCPVVVERVGLQQLRFGNKYGYSMDWPNVKTPNGYQLAQPDSYDGASYRLDKIPHPAEFLLLVDSDGSYFRVRSTELKGTVSSILDRHSGGVNVLRADQHVDFVRFEAIATQAALPEDQNTWFQAN
jgi:prepilin-type N-terminal cleavage/methylation domain-containing protein/prepilin-type processing-associated H-X9-DG protein